MIRPDFDPLADLPPDTAERVDAPPATRARAKTSPAKPPERPAFPPAPIPAWAQASGRAGEGDPLFAAGAGLALLDAALRRDAPEAGVLRARLALQSATASAKILRINADAAALRDLRFAVGDPLGPAATLLSLWSDGAGRPPSLDAESDLPRGGAGRPRSAGPERPRCEPEGLRRGGRSGFGGQQRPPPWHSPPSRTPQRPPPKFSRFGCSTWSSPFDCAGHGPCR